MFFSKNSPFVLFSLIGATIISFTVQTVSSCACMRACIRVRVCLHSPFSVVYSPPLSPLSSIFLQKEHGCALRPDLASTEIKSAGINTAYQCTKGKHNFPLTPFSITRTPTVHFHGSSNLWTNFFFFLSSNDF